MSSVEYEPDSCPIHLIKQLIDEGRVEIESERWWDHKVRKDFGSSVRKLRLSKKLSLKRLASLIEVDKSYLSRAERGIIPYSLNKIYEISIMLDTSVHDLLVTSGLVTHRSFDC